VKSLGRYDAEWARKVERAFKGAVATSFSEAEVAGRLAGLGCSRVDAQVWQTPKKKRFTVPGGALSASLLQDLLLTVRELDR